MSINKIASKIQVISITKILPFVVFMTWFITGCKSIQENVTPPETHEIYVPSTLKIFDDLPAQEKIMQVFAEAYPGKITGVAFLDNDWTMLVNGTRFYFANGRFLPEALREQWGNYIPYDFYDYPWIGTHQQRQLAYKNPVYSIGSSFLFDTLYRSATEDDSWALQEKYSFLGVKLLIHVDIKPHLERTAAQIRAAAKTDSSIIDWLSELQTGVSNYGWSWRPIAGTSRRSNHSYGTAIDLLPVDLKGRKVYWRWDTGGNLRPSGSASGTDSNITVDDYFMPPEAVVKAFEDNGFIWGGKWDLIDTIHFEYRPEILLLNAHK
ncbi:MAG: M15 family metallopeptidase [Treponema sp.]|jgi:hypothetical protein|nr:M15 family metallopeptidase [Treponema sp.]